MFLLEAAMILAEDLTMKDKLAILADAAKYDVACTSSGVSREGKKETIGNTVASGICHSFSADGRCISLLKILFTNECIFDCKYCINRRSNDVPRATFTPEEVCRLTVEFYRRNYIEGLFLSSGVLHSPNETMEQIIKTLVLLRETYQFHGYIHCKAIPGASEDLIETAGWYADRMSVNLELPTAEGLSVLAPHKNRKTILNPMRQIQDGILQSQHFLGMKGGNQGAYWYTTQKQNKKKQINETEFLEWTKKPKEECLEEPQNLFVFQEKKNENVLPDINASYSALQQNYLRHSRFARGFVPAGQSSQIIIGATKESDYQILSVAEALYQKFDLKRVFYSAFVRVNDDRALPVLPDGPPLLREHRLYQADWLLRYYGFQADELLSDKRPNFNAFLDPKCDWAIAHLEYFPVEVAAADYFLLLRIPGIGMKSAKRIIEARKHGKLTFDALKKMGVVLKRAHYFITCHGKQLFPVRLEENYITRELLETNDRGITYQQLSLFDDSVFSSFNAKEELQL